MSNTNEGIDWVNRWREMMCRSMPIQGCGYFGKDLKCKTPDGVVSCNQCRYKCKED